MGLKPNASKLLGSVYLTLGLAPAGVMMHYSEPGRGLAVTPSGDTYLLATATFLTATLVNLVRQRQMDHMKEYVTAIVGAMGAILTIALAVLISVVHPAIAVTMVAATGYMIEGIVTHPLIRDAGVDLR